MFSIYFLSLISLQMTDEGTVLSIFISFVPREREESYHQFIIEIHNFLCVSSHIYSVKVGFSPKFKQINQLA